jgi:pimeloyl-ACP methyl ester carboxylesterase
MPICFLSLILFAADPLPAAKGEWHGFAKHEFTVGGRNATVVSPKTPAPGLPWIWHGEFFGHKPAPDIALLKKGFHIVYLSATDLFGAPEATKAWDALYDRLVITHGFAPKMGLVGLSRGGLYCYHYAIAHPDRVACIYGDAPVCDLKSWPGGKPVWPRGTGKGSAGDWNLVKKIYGWKSNEEGLDWKGNPVDNLAPLAKAKIPLLHVVGDADDVVPVPENTEVIETRYKALGGNIQVIHKPGVGHHPHGLDDPTPIVEFLAKYAGK